MTTLQNRFKQYTSDHNEEVRILNELRPEYDRVQQELSLLQRQVFAKQREFKIKQTQFMAQMRLVKQAYVKKLQTARNMRRAQANEKMLMNKLVRYEKSNNISNGIKAQIRLKLRAIGSAYNGSANNVNAVAKNRANATKRL